jgi:hypothetical protein
MFVVVISHREGMDVTEPHRGARLSCRLLPRVGPRGAPFINTNMPFQTERPQQSVLGRLPARSWSLYRAWHRWQRLVLAAMADTACGGPWLTQQASGCSVQPGGRNTARCSLYKLDNIKLYFRVKWTIDPRPVLAAPRAFSDHRGVTPAPFLPGIAVDPAAAAAPGVRQRDPTVAETRYRCCHHAPGALDFTGDLAVAQIGFA